MICYNKYNVPKEQAKRTKRSKNESDENDTPRPASKRKRPVTNKTLGLTQEQVNATVEQVVKMSNAATNDDDNSETLVDSSPKSPAKLKSMLREAWAARYPHIPFPEDLLSLNESTPQETVVSESSDSETDVPSKPRKSGRYYVGDFKLPNGHVVKDLPNNYTVVTKDLLGKLEPDHAFVEAMRQVWKFSRKEPPLTVKLLYGAYSSSYPTIPTESQEILIQISRFTLLLQIKKYLDPKYHVKFQKFFDEDKVCDVSPSARSLDNYVEDLAVIQAIIISSILRKAKSVNIQTDTAPNKKEAKLITCWDENDTTDTPYGSVRQFFAGLESAGKSSEDCAEGIDHALTNSFGLSNLFFKLCGITRDSGGGTPESLLQALFNVGRMDDHARAESCGNHDEQSVFRLPVQYFIGNGGVDNRNGVQAAHAVFDLFSTFKELGNWKPLISQIWKDAHPNTPVPKELLGWVQKPIITRWWTIGEVCRFLMKYWNIVFRMAVCVINTSKTDEARNKIASGLYSLMMTPAIKAEVCFMDTYSREYMNEQMAWATSVDENVGAPGFLTFHRVVRYFLKITILENLKRTWKTSRAFQRFRGILEEMPPEDRSILEKLPDKFLDVAVKQVHKHNGRYLHVDNLLFKGALGEEKTGKFIARLLLGRSLVDDTGAIVLETAGELEPFLSRVHGFKIDIVSFVRFLHDNTKDCIGEIRDSPLVKEYKPVLTKISEGFNIWDEEVPSAVTIRKDVLNRFAAQSSSQQNCEALVYKATRICLTGKSERRCNAISIAANGLKQFFIDDDSPSADSDEDGRDELVENNQVTTKKKKKQLRGRHRFKHMHKTVLCKEAEYEQAKSEIPDFDSIKKRIEASIKSPSAGYLEKRKQEQLSDLLEKRNQVPRSNARMRQRGCDLSGRLMDEIPYAEVKKSDNHEDSLDAEIQFRREAPYLPPEHADKLEQPVPSQKPESVGSKKPFGTMTFTDKKNWLKVDVEYRYRMNWLLENDFKGTVDMKNLNSKMFTPMNPDVVFEIPTGS